MGIGTWDSYCYIFDFASKILFFCIPLWLWMCMKRPILLDPCPLILLFLTLIIAFFWVFATKGELRLFHDYFEEPEPVLPNFTKYIAVGFAGFLVFLILLYCNILLYSSLYLCLRLFEIFGIGLRNSEIRDRLVLQKNTHTKPKQEKTISKYPKKLEAIEIYYFKRPQIQLAVIAVFFSFVSVVLSFIAFSELISDPKTTFISFLFLCEPISQFTYHWLLRAAYIIMIFTLALNEVAYIIWRRKRDAVLGKSYTV